MISLPFPSTPLRVRSDTVMAERNGSHIFSYIDTMPLGYVYILKCYDNSYYTSSTKHLDLRVKQHQKGEGANHTKKRLPVELIYFEEYLRIDLAFYREKQIQGWSRAKKEALINGNTNLLPSLSECTNHSHSKNR